MDNGMCKLIQAVWCTWLHLFFCGSIIYHFCMKHIKCIIISLFHWSFQSHLNFIVTIITYLKMCYCLPFWLVLPLPRHLMHWVFHVTHKCIFPLTASLWTSESKTLVSTCLCVLCHTVFFLVLMCSQLNSSEGAIQQAKTDLPLPLKIFS